MNSKLNYDQQKNSDKSKSPDPNEVKEEAKEDLNDIQKIWNESQNDNFEGELDEENIPLSSKRVSEKKFKCQFCPKSFKNHNILQNHCKRIHKKQNDVKCDECNEIFNSNIELKKHKKLKHPKEIKLHKCEICDYENESITQINMHIKRVHEDTRDQICEHCGKAFVLKSYLAKHIQG